MSSVVNPGLIATEEKRFNFLVTKIINPIFINMNSVRKDDRGFKAERKTCCFAFWNCVASDKK